MGRTIRMMIVKIGLINLMRHGSWRLMAPSSWPSKSLLGRFQQNLGSQLHTEKCFEMVKLFGILYFGINVLDNHDLDFGDLGRWIRLEKTKKTACRNILMIGQKIETD